MTSLIVVVLEPGCKGGCALGVGGENPPVGPFALEGAVESFHFPVLPRAVRLDEDLAGAKIGADSA